MRLGGSFRPNQQFNQFGQDFDPAGTVVLGMTNDALPDYLGAFDLPPNPNRPNVPSHELFTASDKFVSIMQELRQSAQTSDVKQISYQADLESISLFKDTVLSPIPEKVNLNDHSAKFSWLLDLKRYVKVPVTKSEHIIAPKKNDLSETMNKMHLLMRDRNYQNDASPTDDSSSSSERSLEADSIMDGRILFDAVEEYEKRVKLFAGCSQVQDTISSIVTELSQSQRTVEETSDKLKKFTAIIEDSDKIAKTIENLEAKIEAAVPAKESALSGIIFELKKALACLTEQLDSNEIAATKHAFDLATQKVSKLLDANKMITTSHTIARKLNNEQIPVSEAAPGALPTCSICATNMIDSCMTCGHSGCESCLQMSAGLCPFCRQHGGIIKLYLN